MIKERYVTKREAAEIKGVSLVTVWHWIGQGKLPVERIGNVILIKRTDLKKVKKVGHGGRPKTKK